VRLTPHGWREILIAFVLLGAVAGGLIAAGQAVLPWIGWRAALPGIVFL